MTDAVKLVVPYAMSNFNLVRLEAPVFAWNPGSMRVLEKCGFEREGALRAGAFKDNEIVDVFLYAIVK
jgi:RimJ/RimL family protein N-acetyltransferase